MRAVSSLPPLDLVEQWFLNKTSRENQHGREYDQREIDPGDPQ